MAVFFTAADNDSIYANGIAFTAMPYRFTVVGKVASLPGSSQTLVWMGDKDVTSEFMVMALKSDGTIEARVLGSSNTFATTANAVTAGQNFVATIIVDKPTTHVRWRVKLNGGSVATFEAVGTTDNVATFDRLAFGRSMDSTPSSPFDGYMQGCFAAGDDDTFADHDYIWNSGTVRDPNAVAASIAETSRWPFDNTSGAVSGTDTYIDDAVGSKHLDTVGGSPIYEASLFDTEDPGAQTGAFTSAEATAVRVVKYVFARPSGTYNWNSSFTETSAKRPTITVTRATPAGGTTTSALTIKAIKSAAVNGTNLEVYAYTSGPIRYGETFTTSTTSGWYTDNDADVTGATTNTAGTNSVGSGFGYSKAIARWSLVPYQVKTSTFDLEVLAKHIDGIAGVTFKQSSTTLGTVTSWGQSALDGLPAYKQSVDPTGYSDGLVTFDFLATPNIGDSSSIRNTATDAPAGSGALAEGPLSVYMNSGGTMTSATRYVSTTGSDTADGLTTSTPFLTVNKAVQSLKASGATIMTAKLAAGTYTYAANESSANNNGPWATITCQDGLTRDDVLIVPGSYDMRFRRLRYKSVSIYFPGSATNCLSENGTFTGDTEMWLDDVELYSDGELDVLNGQKWYATTEIDRMWVTDSYMHDLTTEGFTACRLVRNSTIEGTQEDIAKGAVMIWGMTASRGREYPASGQHPDVIQPTSASDLGDVNQIFGFIRALDSDGQQWGCGNGPENYWMVNCLFVQTTGDQYLSQLGEPDETCTTRHVIVENVGFTNSDMWLRHFDATTVFYDCAFRNCYAQDFGAIGTTNDDYDITYENIHEWQGSTLNTRFASNTGTWTTGAISWVDGTDGDYDANAVNYHPSVGSDLIRSTTCYMPYTLDLVSRSAGGYVGPYYLVGSVSTVGLNPVLRRQIRKMKLGE